MFRFNLLNYKPATILLILTAKEQSFGFTELVLPYEWWMSPKMNFLGFSNQSSECEKNRFIFCLI